LNGDRLIPMSQANRYLCFGKVAVLQANLKWEDFWIQVHDYWLTIGKNVDSSPSFLLPLDLTNLTGGFQETRIQNSIYIATTAITGSVKLYLQSSNRYDILQLFQALKNGQSILKEAIARKAIPRQCSFEAKTLGILFGLGRSVFTFKETPDSIEFAGDKVPTRIAFIDIRAMHAKVNDSGSPSHLIIEVSENGQASSKACDCVQPNNLKSAIACFLMNWREANDDSPLVESPALVPLLIADNLI
jgi:hypothetical protein